MCLFLSFAPTVPGLCLDFAPTDSEYYDYEYSITSLVRASLVRGSSVVRGFERKIFHPTL
jgi:hypothetical protein